MTLAEFMKKRREELGLTWNDIIDGGIANNTWCNIVNGKQLTVKPATMERLARLLKCTIGDIQACLAEMPNPLRKEAAKPEGIHVIGGKPPKAEPKLEPVEEQPDEIVSVKIKPEALVIDPEELADDVEEETLYEFKARMKDMCLRKFVEQNNGEKAKILIAENLLKELLEV